MEKTFLSQCLERNALSLLDEWDREKNGALGPEDVSPGSHKSVWWRCGAGHSWQARVYSRSGGSGCPYCAGKIPNAFSISLAQAYPHVAAMWHPDKNGSLGPGDVLPASHQKVWWRCAAGHEWQARVNSLSGGSGCPVCANRRVEKGVNDLATLFPELAAQWHPVKNGILMPDAVSPGSSKKVWWLCDAGHEWQASLSSRAGGKNGCPVCAGKIVVPGVNDLAHTFPRIAEQWHPEKNGSLAPENVTAFSNSRVWWLCPKGHEYRAAVSSRTKDASDCPYCAGRSVLVGFNDLETLMPAIAKQWHTELNGNLSPRMVTCGSRKKVWWQCSEGHVWKAVIYSRTGARKCGCPVCAGRVKESKQIRYADIVASDRANT